MEEPNRVVAQRFELITYLYTHSGLRFYRAGQSSKNLRISHHRILFSDVAPKGESFDWQLLQLGVIGESPRGRPPLEQFVDQSFLVRH